MVGRSDGIQLLTRAFARERPLCGGRLRDTDTLTRYPNALSTRGHSRLDFAHDDCASSTSLSENKYVAQAITRDPEIMHGMPVFRGTRVPVQTLFDYLEGGETLEDFLEGFPTVSRSLAIEALEEAKQLLLARA